MSAARAKPPAGSSLVFATDAPPGAVADRHQEDSIDGMGAIDFVLKFEHVYVEDATSDEEREEMGALHKKRKDLVNAIRFSGLKALRRQSKTVDDKGRHVAYFVFVFAPEDVISQEAARLRINKKLKPAYKDAESDVVGYDIYNEDEAHLFESSPGASFFTSLERQRCIFAKLEASLVNGGAGLDIDTMCADGVISDWTFMPNALEAEALSAAWVHKYLSPAPVHAVREYFGERIGFYFAFFDEYIKFLRPLSIFSVATFAYQMYLTAQTSYWQTDNLLVPIYAIAICIWSTVMIETWKRRQSVLAWQWGVTSSEENEPSRPEYLADKRTRPQIGVFRHGVGFVPLNNESTRLSIVRRLSTLVSPREAPVVKDAPDAEAGSRAPGDDDTPDDDVVMTLVFPPGVHYRRVLLSLALTLSVIAAVAVGALFTLAYKIVLVRSYPQWGNYLGSAINVAFIALTDTAWSRLALTLNDWEMYRTDSQWFGALVYKTFLFRFINKNATPFYIAFAQGARLELFGLGVKDSCPNNDCLRALSDYLLVAVVFSEISRNLLTLVPLALDKYKARKAAQAKAAAAAAAQPMVAAPEDGVAKQQLVHAAASDAPTPLELVEAELLKSVYPGTFDEMLELSVQFGYVVMFAVGFPIAPFFVQLNNMVERKTDALKTLKMRRPRYRGATGIGSWLNVLEFLTVFSVVTNMLILFFSSSVTRDALGNTFSLTNVLLIVVFVEHLLFALKLGIAIGIDDVPRWVERARTRQSLRHRTESERSENERNKRLAAQIQDMSSSDDDDDSDRMALDESSALVA
ncbi:hypothetical protein KFE25_009497 [Diacronema lutheri]|uniref:Anoctamin transmembrane domain-containing protein n=2 Tax=Diacronema lutheri TaxID=2081491 RepID=A0A8J5XXY3_DIALT|nr:hypothetical protein KFE25_009497 [Diacronema lutheri]